MAQWLSCPLAIWVFLSWMAIFFNLLKSIPVLNPDEESAIPVKLIIVQ